MKQFSILFFFILYIVHLSAQNNYTRFESIDVQSYIFEIHLNDSTNRIEGKTNIKIKFLKPSQKITLDLIGRNDSTISGMEVSRVIFNGNPVTFFHQNDQLEIGFNKIINKGEIIEFEINYSGIPADGLIISTNKFGDRTFFGDNWPNRARNWLPTVDHPSDKATPNFIVYAPEYYQVVSNGVLIEESNLGKGIKLTHWKENVPISTKLMVIGVARFAVQYKNGYKRVPISSWVFPQNRDEGFRDYSVGDKALKYFSKIIGPYSYEKLAHVQSKTRYGGMENASCIFYAENSVTGKKQDESLMAHETAHQWFGNSVTEQNWHHIWLSEGFATYLTHLYNEHFYGEDSFRNGLIRDREQIINFVSRNSVPIIDTTVTEYDRLLNTNSYQKASWFLHMLREKVGDTLFFGSLQEYYRIFRDSTALTQDFQNVMEKVSGQELGPFFHQWLLQPGIPKLKVSWSQKLDKNVVLKISQMQENYLFTFPIEIEFILENKDKIRQAFIIKNRQTEINIPFSENIKTIQLDPSVKLLFERINKEPWSWTF